MQVQVQLPLETIQEAANLYNRYQAGSGFRAYLKERSNPITVLCALMVLTSVALTAGTIVSLAGARAYLMLLALLLAPVVLIGSGFVQALFYFGWLENRALAKGLRHALEREGPVKRWLRKNLQAEMGKLPAVPWLFAAVFVLLPLAATAKVAPAIAAGLVLVHVAGFILFARLDR